MQHAVRLIDDAAQRVALVYRDNLRALRVCVGRDTRAPVELRDSTCGYGVHVDGVAAVELLAAGLEAGDLLVAINEELLRDASHALSLLQHPGEVEMRVLRRD